MLKGVQENSLKSWGDQHRDIEKALENLKKAEAASQDMGVDCWLRKTQEVLERVEG